MTSTEDSSGKPLKAEVGYAVCQFADDNDPNKYHVLCTDEIYYKDDKKQQYVPCKKAGIQYTKFETLRRKVLEDNEDGGKTNVYYRITLVKVLNAEVEAKHFIRNIGKTIGRKGRLHKPTTRNTNTPNVVRSVERTVKTKRCVNRNLKATTALTEIKKLKAARIRAKIKQETCIGGWIKKNHSTADSSNSTTKNVNQLIVGVSSVAADEHEDKESDVMLQSNSNAINVEVSLESSGKSYKRNSTNKSVDMQEEQSQNVPTQVIGLQKFSKYCTDNQEPPATTLTSLLLDKKSLCNVEEISITKVSSYAEKIEEETHIGGWIQKNHSTADTSNSTTKDVNQLIVGMSSVAADEQEDKESDVMLQSNCNAINVEVSLESSGKSYKRNSTNKSVDMQEEQSQNVPTQVIGLQKFSKYCTDNQEPPATTLTSLLLDKKSLCNVEEISITKVSSYAAKIEEETHIGGWIKKNHSTADSSNSTTKDVNQLIVGISSVAADEQEDKESDVMLQSNSNAINVEVSLESSGKSYKRNSTNKSVDMQEEQSQNVPTQVIGLQKFSKCCTDNQEPPATTLTSLLLDKKSQGNVEEISITKVSSYAAPNNTTEITINNDESDTFQLLQDLEGEIGSSMNDKNVDDTTTKKVATIDNTVISVHDSRYEYTDIEENLKILEGNGENIDSDATKTPLILPQTTLTSTIDKKQTTENKDNESDRKDHPTSRTLTSNENEYGHCVKLNRKYCTSSMSTLDNEEIRNIEIFPRNLNDNLQMPSISLTNSTSIVEKSTKDKGLNESMKKKPKITNVVRITGPDKIIQLFVPNTLRNVPASSKTKQQSNEQQKQTLTPSTLVQLSQMNLSEVPSSFESSEIQSQSKMTSDYPDTTPRRANVEVTKKNLTSITREKIENGSFPSDTGYYGYRSGTSMSASGNNNVDNIDESFEGCKTESAEEKKYKVTNYTMSSPVMSRKELEQKESVELDSSPVSAESTNDFPHKRYLSASEEKKFSNKNLVLKEDCTQSMKATKGKKDTSLATNQRLARNQRNFEKSLMIHLDRLNCKQDKILRVLEGRPNENDENVDNNLGNREPDNRTVDEIIDSADSDGKVEILDVKIDAIALGKAATSNNARKRVNALVDGMWSEEERLKLRVRKTKDEKFTVIDKKDLTKIKAIARYLNKFRDIHDSNKSLQQSKINEYVSAKLKAEKNRKSEGFQVKKKIRQEQKKNTETASTQIENEELTSDQEIELNVPTCSTSKPMNTIRCIKRTVPGMDVVDEPKQKSRKLISDVTPIKTREKGLLQGEIACTGKVRYSYERLIQLLGKPLRIDECIDEETPEAENSNSSKLYSWLQLRREMNITDEKLCKILTADAFVLFRGKCRLLDLPCEMALVFIMCEAVKSIQDENNTFLYDDFKFTDGPLKSFRLLTYIFYKYTSESKFYCQKTKSQRRCLYHSKILKLKLEVNILENVTWDYDKLIEMSQMYPYCEISNNVVKKYHIEEIKGSDCRILDTQDIQKEISLSGRQIILNNWNKFTAT